MIVRELITELLDLLADPHMPVRVDGAEPEVSIVHEDEGEYLNIGKKEG